MRITFQLEPDDVRRFEDAIARARHKVRTMDECDIVDAAKQTLDTLPIGGMPQFVRRQVGAVQRLLLMLEDEEFALPQPFREDVLRTLVYFSDPEDLIPDEVGVIGLLDDAIMLALLLKRQRRLLDAYDTWTAAVREAGPPSDCAESRMNRARSLADCRRRIQARLMRAARSPKRPSSPS